MKTSEVHKQCLQIDYAEIKLTFEPYMKRIHITHEAKITAQIQKALKPGPGQKFGT